MHTVVVGTYLLFLCNHQFLVNILSQILSVALYKHLNKCKLKIINISKCNNITHYCIHHIINFLSNYTFWKMSSHTSNNADLNDKCLALSKYVS